MQRNCTIGVVLHKYKCNKHFDKSLVVPGKKHGEEIITVTICLVLNDRPGDTCIQRFI